MTFFVIGLMCHGELARRRPPVSALTEFYLMISLGGLLGGSFTAILAPIVFNGVYEYPLAIVAGVALLPPALSRLLNWGDVLFAGGLLAAIFGFHAFLVSIESEHVFKHTAFFIIALGLLVFSRKTRPLGFAFSIAAILASSISLMVATETVARGRSFFGVYRVAESDSGAERTLIHGTTNHGGQRTLPDGDVSPTYYHAPGSPVA